MACSSGQDRIPWHYGTEVYAEAQRRSESEGVLASPISSRARANRNLYRSGERRLWLASAHGRGLSGRSWRFRLCLRRRAQSHGPHRRRQEPDEPLSVGGLTRTKKTRRRSSSPLRRASRSRTTRSSPSRSLRSPTSSKTRATAGSPAKWPRFSERSPCAASVRAGCFSASWR